MTETLPLPRGRVKAHHVPAMMVIPCGRAIGKSTTSMVTTFVGAIRKNWEPITDWKSNLVLREWAAIGAQLLASGRREYRIGTMYIEYANVALPGDPAPIPTFDRNPASGVTYYNALITNPANDYLRVPIIAAPVDTSDPVLYPKGNLVTFFAQTQGTVGVHSKPFGDVYNSTVIGAALVATPNPDDATEDLVLSRFYFDVPEQKPKLPTGQIGLEWELTLQ